MKKILLESLLIAVVGAGLGFAANALSPRGLRLSRNFFPEREPNVARANSNPNLVNGPARTNTASPYEQIAARLQQQGIHLAGSNQVIQFFNDPRSQQNLVVFLDARNDEQYQEGHIPGAYQLDYYHPENYLGTVLAVCQMAQQIIVYCNGGECEASEHTADFLVGAHVPADKLYVYAGGMAEWNTNRLPVEFGPRKSGQLRSSSDAK